jgi:hypothetical protein
LQSFLNCVLPLFVLTQPLSILCYHPVRLHAICFSPARDETKCALIVVSGSARLTLKARQLRLIYFPVSISPNPPVGTKQNLLCIPGRSFTEGRLS